jgi:predicted regulator of Ras-like GTPase activity (Roadblock/LC7/MglB family)
MKKQLLILIVAFAAISFSTAYGQLAPRAVTCLTADALHPIAGSPYTYEITVPTPAGTKQYTWFVTQDQHFINAGVLTGNREAVPASTIVAATGAGYNDVATGTNTVSITWKSFAYDPLAPVFVVIQVQNTASTPDACVSKNMKVYKIVPQNAFTLDITNLGTGGSETEAGAIAGTYGSNIDRCIHDIVDAQYDATAPEGVIYDFGADYMFFEVVAANFSTSWKPSFTLTGVDAEETVTVEWATDKAFTTPHALTLAAGVWSSADVYTVAAAGGFVGAAGESIYVRVKLDHTTTVNYEGLLDEVVVLAVDGITNLAAPAAQQLGDIHTDAGGSPSACPWVDLYANDIATQTLKPRPTINAGATMPAPGLLPVKP